MGDRIREKVVMIPRDPGISWSTQMEEENRALAGSDDETVYSPVSVNDQLEDDEVLRHPGEENREDLSPTNIKSPGENLTTTLANTTISEDDKCGPEDGEKYPLTTVKEIMPVTVVSTGGKKNKKRRRARPLTDSDRMPPPPPPSLTNRKRQLSTSPKDKPAPKKKNFQSGNGIQVFITYSHDTMLSISTEIFGQFKLFIDENIKNSSGLDFLIQIESRSIILGHIVFTCTKAEVANWLIKTTEQFRCQSSSTAVQDFKLKAWTSDEFPRAVFTVMTRGDVKPNFIEIFNLLAKQNENFNINAKYMVAKIIPCQGFFVSYLKVDEELKLYLRAREGLLYYLSGKLEFRE